MGVRRPQVTLIAGPPCAGKNTYLRQHADSDDLIIDYDALAVALQLDAASHERVDAHKPFIYEARDAILERLGGAGHQVGAVWVINSGARQRSRQQYRERYDAHVVVVYAPEKVCLERARCERPTAWQGYVRQWFAQYEPDARDEIFHGYEVGTDMVVKPHPSGSRYRKARAAVLAASSTCWICGHEGADQVDHLESRSVNPVRDIADVTNLRPAHGVNGCATCGLRCNQSRGDGRATATPARRSRQW